MAEGVQLITVDSDADNDMNILSGTNFAAPSVTSSLNLIWQLFEQLHPEAQLLRASTRKVQVIHTEEGNWPNPRLITALPGA